MVTIKGQALIEYLLVLSLLVVIGGRIMGAFGGFIGHGMGTLNSVLSSHLSVGVCKGVMCFPDSYINGRSL